MMQEELSFEEPEYIKRCSKCKEHKVAEINFYKDKAKKDGYDVQCKACRQIKHQQIRDKHREINTRPDKVWDPEYTKVCPKCETEKKIEFFQYKPSAKDGYGCWCIECEKERKQKPRFKYTDLRKGAKARGYDFTLEIQDTSGLLLSDCYYCGKPSVEGVKIHGLDRIDNSKGYHLDNVVPCCEQCNFAKRTHTKEEFIDMCKRVADRHSTYEKSNMESIKIYLENKDLGEFMKENFDYPVW